MPPLLRAFLAVLSIAVAASACSSTSSTTPAATCVLGGGCYSDKDCCEGTCVGVVVSADLGVRYPGDCTITADAGE